MSKERPTNMAASVRARLQNHSQTHHEDFQLVLTRYAMERLLFRLSQSPHSDVFVLKGAMLFLLWTGKSHRPTKDLDLLGSGEPSQDRFAAIFRDIFALAVEDDGLVFDPTTVSVERIREDQEYEGWRVVAAVTLERARVPLQVDIGFGDAITPTPSTVEFPTLLDFAAPVLKAYPRETVVAEKFEAMVSLDLANSRMKDFYDIWVLSREFDFDGATLAKAIERTFANRNTKVESLPTALTPKFGSDASKQMQWQGFLKKAKLSDAPAELQVVVDALVAFLSPVAAAIRSGMSFDGRWEALGPWC